MKAVAIFDMPSSCKKCPAMNSAMACNIAKRPFSESMVLQILHGDKGRPGWCPLKSLPEHKLDWRAGENGYESGFNDCLDLIGGGE